MSTIFNNYGLIAAEMHADVSAAIVVTATEIEQDVKGRAPTAVAGGSDHGGPRAAPYKTGAARRSYHQDRAGLEDPIEPSVAVGSDPGIADYVEHLEYGTVHMAPRPHLTPSSEAQRVPHEERVAAAVMQAAKTHGKL